MQVLIRPFPWEAHNAQALVTSVEGLSCSSHWPGAAAASLRRLPRRLKASYVLFCVLYSVAFVYAFSTFGNFGILARERVQVLPFVLALRLPPAPAWTGRPGPTPDRPHPTSAW